MNQVANRYQVDIIIVGGGIAGLWTLARLRQAGYQAILFEADHLGAVQTGASQGIIHGGTKYALTGKLTQSSQAIKKMPERWQACLDGHGEVDLSQAKQLSAHQYLWTTKSLASKISGFFASKVMTSRMQRLTHDDLISPFNSTNFHGEVYQLNEPVLDVQSVIESLRQQFKSAIYQLRIEQIERLYSDDSQLIGYEIKAPNESIQSKVMILAAGAGNQTLLKQLDLDEPKMQRRPLLMPMLKASTEILPPLYAHCLGASALPRMTITTHKLLSTEQHQENVWYIGGEIAEQGITRSNEEQVHAGKKLLDELIPWMDFSKAQWSTLAIDRAEPEMPDGSRPAEPAVTTQEQIITAWPVKLAMAPLMVDKVFEAIESMGIRKNDSSINLQDIILANTSQLPWEKEQHWLC